MKRFKKIYRIPTLFALTLIAIALGLGLTVDYFYTKQQNELKATYAPKKLSVVNLSDTEATITWQSSVFSEGLVIYGTGHRDLNQYSQDFRDNPSSTNQYLSHFIPLTKLNPNTTYYYKIKSQNLVYPDDPLTFKTGPTIKSETTINAPLMGSVVTPDLKPLNDALVFLNLPGANPLATITSNSGNFILPLKDLRTEDLSRTFDISTESEAQLVILKGNDTSRNKIKLPPIEASLRALVLGQDLDLRTFQPPATTSATIAPQNKYDLNSDGKVNALDLSVVAQSIGQLSINSKADLNDDGKIDQKDFDLIKKEAE